MRKILRIALFALMALVSVQCRDDDDASPDSARLLTFEVPVGSIADGDRHWIVLSDAAGAILDTARLSNNTKYTFEPPAGFGNARITLTVVQYRHTSSTESSPSVYIRTYADLKTGDYLHPVPQRVSWVASAGTASVSVPDFPFDGSYDKVMLSRPGNVDGYIMLAVDANGSLDVNFPIAGRRSPFLLSFMDTDNSYKYLYKEIEVGREQTYRMTDFTPGELWKVSIPDLRITGFTMSGQNASGTFSPFISRYRFDGGSRESFNLPYPKAIFTSYTTNISGTSIVDNRVVNSAYYLEGPTPPATMKTIDGEIRYTVTGNVITSNQPVDCDLVTYIVKENWHEGGVQWIVYCGGGNRSVTVPVIPEPLASVYQVPSFGKLYEDPFSYSVGLTNYPMIAGYDDYMNRTFIGTPFKVTEAVAKSIGYNKQTGGRFAPVETLPRP